jgi:tetratricopeptide (TPR) repeat protein
MLSLLDGATVLADLSTPEGEPQGPQRRSIQESPPLRIGRSAILYSTSLAVSMKGDRLSVAARSNRYFRDQRSFPWEGGRTGGVRAIAENMESREFPLMRYLPPHLNVLHPLGVIRENFVDAKGRGGVVPMFVLYPRCEMDLAQYITATEHVASSAQVEEFSTRRFELLMYVHDVLDAVAHLRLHRTVHRHIKLENILLITVGNQRRRAVLSDFSEARTKGGVRAPMPNGGDLPLWSLDHMVLPFTAPEVMNSKDDQMSADMWTVGVVCLAVLHSSSTTLTSDPVDDLAQVVQKTGTSNLEALQQAVDVVLDKYFEPRPLAAKDGSVLGGDFIRKCLRVDPAGRPDPAQVPKSMEAVAAADLAMELRRVDKYRPRQCALDVLPNSMTYKDAALMCLLRGETATGWWALGRSMFEQECYVEAIAADPRHSLAHLSLGELLASGTGTTATATLRSGRVVTARDCFMEAASCDEKNSTAFIRLGKLIGAAEIVTLSDGCTVTQRDCFIRALAGDPQNAVAHHCLGLSLSADGAPGETAEVRGVLMNEQKCYIEAIRCNPQLADAFVCLGLTLAPDADPVRLCDGRQLTQQQCFAEAVKLDAANANAWINLGTTFDGSVEYVTVASSVTTANGSPITRRVTEPMCYIEAIAADPKNPRAYFNLATVLRPAEVVTLKDGRQLTERQCYVEALWLDPRNSKAMNNLGYGMTSWETVTLRDARVMTKQDCYIEALNLDPNDANAFVNLGKLIPKDESVRLRDGRNFTQRGCFIEALHCDPSNAEGYHELGVTMRADEEVVLRNGKKLTLGSCLTLERQSRASSPR